MKDFDPKNISLVRVTLKPRFHIFIFAAVLDFLQRQRGKSVAKPYEIDAFVPLNSR